MVRLITAAILAASVSCSAGPSAGQNDGETFSTQSLHEPDVRYEPSPQPVVNAMLELADVNERDVVYDLGSGDGRIPITAARDHGARAVGIEIDPDLVARAKANASKAAVAERVTFRNQDLFRADLRDATVVTLFLSPEINLKLRPKLLAELAPGARIVSHYHDMGEWIPKRTIMVMDRPIYLWTVTQAQAQSH